LIILKEIQRCKKNKYYGFNYDAAEVDEGIYETRKLIEIN